MKTEISRSLLQMSRGKPLVPAWYRFWTEENHSYGFIDETIPEIGIALIAEVRSTGIGTQMMNKLQSHAKEIGCKKISLSVDPNNYARNFYEKLGFEKVGESGTSWTMVLKLT